MHRTIVLLVVWTFLQLQPSWADEPARPIERAAPGYPEECNPENGDYAEQQIVDVGYDITSEGMTSNIRVLQSTNICFEAAAVATVREWRFEPRKIDGRPASQLDNTIRLSFVRNDEPSPEISPEIEAKLALMASKIYPVKCARDAKDVEYVKLQYDISNEGVPKNVEIVDSTNSCFNKTAIGAIQGWRYEPKIVDGQAVERVGVKVTLTFRIEE